MDQTIRKILELDTATEERLKASELQCSKRIADAKKQAAAMKQAQKIQTRDGITELEEQARSEWEQKIGALRADFDRRTDAVSEHFASQHDALLRCLFDETLQAAEQ